MINSIYSGRGFNHWEIGDVDVVYDGKLFHLFHLIIPNHDYIAHATSTDGIHWKRVRNAIFVGHPGEWDDDMLWTMHTTWNEEEALWEMYYTGLTLAENGKVQRVGRATSQDLYHWEKDTNFEPLAPDPVFYESADDETRGWTSFRDPFLFKEHGEERLLVAARTNHGPYPRRGCVALLRKENGHWEPKPPLFHPLIYDDMEVPNLYQVNDNYYLVASIREDRKIRYWHSKSPDGPFYSFPNNVLFPQGNFAGRVLKVDDKFLAFSFYYINNDPDGERAFSPPKEIVAREDGEIYLRSADLWSEVRTRQVDLTHFNGYHTNLGNNTAYIRTNQKSMTVGTHAAYEFFTCTSYQQDYLWEGCICFNRLGKGGIIFDMDNSGSGYFISIDSIHGFVQLRSWGMQDNDPVKDYLFRTLQSNQFNTKPNHTYHFRLINYGNYIEFSLDDAVLLSLVDYTYQGGEIGLYCSNAELTLSESHIDLLRQAPNEYI